MAMIITGVIRPRVAVHDGELVHCMDKSLTLLQEATMIYRCLKV